MPYNPISDKSYLLKRTISILEWDIPHITNKDLKIRKEEELGRYKQELQKLKNEENRLN